MTKTYFKDMRGWDLSDPFGLTIIGALDTLEKEGHLKLDKSKRNRIGEINLALNSNLDYYFYILVPKVNIARNLLLADAIKNPKELIIYDNKHLGMTYYLESMFKTLITIDELIKQMVLEIMEYLGILNPYISMNSDKREIKQSEDVLKIILEILKKKSVITKEWYTFINGLRNFATHEGVLTIDYIEGSNIHFYKKRWDKRYCVSMHTIRNNLNKFVFIREVLRKGLSDVNYWKTKMSII